ncbi:MAG: sigma 54-interacting transcriptional regulator [Gemmatimonadaceae bacterium]|nr:sigma 54-interacting transcriptional regulator [Gemmatimonadaceae bacterium]
MLEIPTTIERDATLPVARELEHRAARRWGTQRPIVVIGRHERLAESLHRVKRFAKADHPILVTGETGTGKELFARASYLFSERVNAPYIAVNCAQFHDGQLMASELFGHKRGSFTGATADHAGVFSDANGGTVFLDEVGELSLPAQAMLLRVLSEGEIVPVGGTSPRQVNVRVVAATSRDLKPMIAAGTFRADLYYRLRYFHVQVPAVRERGDDWELIAQHYMARHAASARRAKRLSPEAYRLLKAYHWPGNVREIRSIVEIGCQLSESDAIECQAFADELEVRARREQVKRLPLFDERDTGSGDPEDPMVRMEMRETDFWTAVHRPYLSREMSRAEARSIVERGLDRTRGSYKRLLGIFNIPDGDYLKFMDFLRHQKLKPE